MIGGYRLCGWGEGEQNEIEKQAVFPSWRITWGVGWCKFASLAPVQFNAIINAAAAQTAAQPEYDYHLVFLWYFHICWGLTLRNIEHLHQRFYTSAAMTARVMVFLGSKGNHRMLYVTAELDLFKSCLVKLEKTVPSMVFTKLIVWCLSLNTHYSVCRRCSENYEQLFTWLLAYEKHCNTGVYLCTWLLN